MNQHAKPAVRALSRIVAAAALAMVSTVSAAQAASFRVLGQDQGTLGGGPCVVFDATTSVPVAATGGCFASGAGQASASAGAGFAQLAVRSQVNTGPFSSGFVARYDATAQFSDFVIFTSADPAATSAMVSVNLRLIGFLGDPLTNFRSSFESFGNIGGRQFRLDFNSTGLDSLVKQGIEQTGGFIFSPIGVVNAAFRTDPVTVDLNTPINFSLRITASALGVNANALAVSEFDVGVPGGAGAFTLIDGVTANSGTWLIDNQRIVVGAVPEPAEWMMLLGGLGLVGAAMRRRNKPGIQLA